MFATGICWTEIQSRKNGFHHLRKKRKITVMKNQPGEWLGHEFFPGLEKPNPLVISSSSLYPYVCRYSVMKHSLLNEKKTASTNWTIILRSLKVFQERKCNSFPGFVMKVITKTGDWQCLGNKYSCTPSIYMAKDLTFHHFICCSNHTPVAQVNSCL